MCLLFALWMKRLARAFVRHHAERDQAFADPAAVRFPVIQGTDDVVWRGETLRHQNIPEARYYLLLSQFIEPAAPAGATLCSQRAPKCLALVSVGLRIGTRLRVRGARCNCQETGSNAGRSR